MQPAKIKELLLQSLEHELGGVKVYEAAIQCAVHPELKEEFEKYREETRHHSDILVNACLQLGIDPEEEIPARKVLRGLSDALVQAMEMARTAGNPQAAQIVAGECVLLAETKDHLDWQLIGEVADNLDDAPKAKALKQAYREVEDQEDEHVYHSKGWCRELWLDSLGLEAVLPPPEETEKVKSAQAAAKAEQRRRKQV